MSSGRVMGEWRCRIIYAYGHMATWARAPSLFLARSFYALLQCCNPRAYLEGEGEATYLNEVGWGRCLQQTWPRCMWLTCLPLPPPLLSHTRTHIIDD